MDYVWLAAGSLLLFAGLAFLWNFHDRKGKPGIAVRVAVIAAAGCICAVILKLTGLKPEWTAMEYLFGGALLVNGCAFLWRLIREGKNGITANVFRLICAVCVSCAVYSALTYGQTIINSDTATSILLPQSQIRNGSPFPAGWNYANGDVWTICIGTFTFPFTALLRDQALARVLGSSLCVLVTVAGIAYLSKKVFRNESWTIAVSLFLLFLGASEVRSQILYESGYTTPMLLIAFGPALFYQWTAFRKKRYAVIFCVYTFLLAMSGIRFTAEQTVPLACGYLAVILLESGGEKLTSPERNFKNVLADLAILVVPAVLGLAGYKWVCSWHNMNDTVNNAMMFAGSLEGCWENFIAYLLNYVRCFGYSPSYSFTSIYGIQNLVSISICALTCVIVPVLQARRIRQESKGTQMFYIFGVVHNAIMMVMIVFCGLTYVRYTMTTLFVWIIISARYIWAWWIEPGKLTGKGLAALFAVAALVECIVLVPASAGWNKAVADRKEFNQSLVDRGLTKGYTTYWHAYNNEVYSDLQIEYGAVDVGSDSVTPFKWLVDDRAYEPAGGKSFLMLGTQENEAIRNNLDAMFGRNEDYFILNGHHIYQYSHDICADFETGLQDGVVRPIEMMAFGDAFLSDGVWEIGYDSSVAGPYTAIRAGEYLVTFRGSSLENCEVDIASDENPEAVSFEVADRNEEWITARVKIAEDLDDIGFMADNRAEEPAWLFEIDVEPVE